MARLFGLILALAGAAAPRAGHASFLSGETLDTAANVLSWLILFLVPCVAIAVFLYVHVLPEVIAERNQHPHKHSIKVLCILSLFFGGMLWPFAWLWAYTKPIGYRAIYGTEKHDDHYLAMAEKARLGTASAEDIRHAIAELKAMSARHVISPELQRALADLESIAAAPTPQARAAQPVAGAE
jgi:CBS domain containing-hemolysin-like protein